MMGLRRFDIRTEGNRDVNLKHRHSNGETVDTPKLATQADPWQGIYEAASALDVYASG
jgi:hypothetical protein